MNATRLGAVLLVAMLLVGVWGGAAAAAATAADQRTDTVCADPPATGVVAGDDGAPEGAAAVGGPVDTPDSVQASMQILAPDDADRFHRGDVVPIELALGEGERATLTISDSDGDVLDLDVTVQDVNRDGAARILLNTFQIGNETRNHGAFTRDSGTEIERVDARAAAGDGPGGDGVLPAGNYTLAVAPGGETVAAEDAADTAVLRLAERGIGDLRVRTAPATASFAPDTVADVEAAIDDGLVTGDRRIVDGDYFVLSVPATGLGGVLHEAVIRSPAVEDPAAFLERVRRADDTDRVGDAFFAATRFGGSLRVDSLGGSLTVGNPSTAAPHPVLGIGTLQTDLTSCEPITVLDMANASTAVLAGTDAAGAIDRYHVVGTLDTDAPELTPGSGNDLYPAQFTSYVTVRPVDPDANRTAPPLARPGGAANESVDEYDTLVDAIVAQDGGVGSVTSWSFRENRIPTLDPWRDVPVVTNTTDATIGGPTPLVAGTELTVTVTTPEGHEPSLERTETTRVESVPGGPNAWNVTVDLDGYPAGTPIDVRVSGAEDEVDLTAEPIRGTLTAEPRVDEFVFRNQTITTDRGEPVVIETLDTTQGGRVVLYDADGDPIGASPTLPRGRHDEIGIEIDQALEEPTAITAVVYRRPEEPYEAGGERVERTAVVTPATADPALEIDAVEDPTDALDRPQDVDVPVTVTNTGGSGTARVDLVFDGRVVATAEPSLDAGETATVTLAIPADELVDGQPTTFRVQTAVDREGGIVAVNEAPVAEDPVATTPTPTDTETWFEPESSNGTADAGSSTGAERGPTDTAAASDDGAGFGTVAALVALALGAALAVRYRRS